MSDCPIPPAQYRTESMTMKHTHESAPAGCRQHKESQMTIVLTPESPEWEEFASALDASLGRWGCDGDGTGEFDPGCVHRRAKAVMTAMGGIDIEETLEYFKDHGGYCDCEILLNVDPW
jgi:hypothetical protein